MTFAALSLSSPASRSVPAPLSSRVRHLNKGTSGKAIYRGGGSIGIIAAARSAFLVMPDPDDPSGDRRIFACSKNNIGPKPRSRAFRLLQPEGHKLARIEWLGKVDTKADELVREPESNRADRLDAQLAFCVKLSRTVLQRRPMLMQRP